ncbi:uncharacterized protein LOC129573932 [Sitodiplosis mosellana]|uniref:uncharacterized protein LOC129573932 n=1 Tax=Sitodiplosis mosellana TaxID=263140 RepID=UPI00244465DC|nr:uncharacterized protein LOC129573932 [Sitodiplosis mosellana]
MSSSDDKTDSGSQNKLDIEAFRHHLLNYRSKADESESDLTYHFDLDSSFKRILNEKRQVTNKENKPPSAEQTTSSANPPEKPLRKDLMKERLRSRVDDSYMDQSSYVMEYSIGTDMEFATINRLLADFNINRDSSVSQKRSPLKMLKITGDSLNEAGPSYQSQRTEEVYERSNTSYARAQEANNVAGTSSSINADDTLEEIEYVLDRGLNYVPKRLINEIKSKSVLDDSETSGNRFKTESQASQKYDENGENIENQENDAIGNEKSIRTVSDYKMVAQFDENEVIVLDSSPENSFITTQNTECYKSAFESIETTYHTAKSDPNNVSVVSIDSDSTINQSEEKPSEQSGNESTKEKFDEECLELSSSTHKDSTGVSEKFGDMPNFNNTLERVEYMMEQGRKMLTDKSSKLTPTRYVQPQHMQNKKTPLSQTKSKVLTPNSASLKKAAGKYLTPNKVDMFKRPDQRNVRSPFAAKSASASKAHAAPVQSRIPMKTASLHKPQFRHIASPIAAYINNTPEVPLMKTIKPMRNLLTEDFSKSCASRALDESTQSVESFPTKSALPRKMYISAAQRKIIDHRHIVTPGGKSVQKLIGNPPLIIRHDGKMKSHGHQAHAQAPPFEDSLADLSVASGDISVQVVRDVHRKN